MRTKTLLIPLLLLLATFALPPAAPLAHACGYDLVGKPVPSPFPVFSPWPHTVTNPGKCTSGSAPWQFDSASPPCPPLPFVGEFGGQFCGPAVPAGAQVFCTVRSLVPMEGLGIVAGIDLDFDGNIFEPVDGPVGRSYSPAPEPTVKPYVHSKPGRVIAYPLVPLPAGVVFVGCA